MLCKISHEPRIPAGIAPKHLHRPGAEGKRLPRQLDLTCHGGDRKVASSLIRHEGSLLPTEVTVALADFVLALCALLGTLLIPFLVLYQVLRLRRRALREAAAEAGRR